MNGSNMFSFRSLDTLDSYLPEKCLELTEGRRFDRYALGKKVSSSVLHRPLLRPLLLSSRLPSLALFVLQDSKYRSSFVMPLKKEIEDQFWNDNC